MILIKLPKNIKIINSDVLKEPVIIGWKSFVPCWCLAGDEPEETKIPVIAGINSHGEYHYHCSKKRHKDYVTVEQCNESMEYGVMEDLDGSNPLPNKLEFCERNIGYEIYASEPKEKYHINTTVVVALRDIRLVGKRIKNVEGRYNLEEDVILAKRFYLPSTHFREAHGFLIEYYRYWEII